MYNFEHFVLYTSQHKGCKLTTVVIVEVFEWSYSQLHPFVSLTQEHKGVQRNLRIRYGKREAKPGRKMINKWHHIFLRLHPDKQHAAAESDLTEIQ